MEKLIEQGKPQSNCINDAKRRLKVVIELYQPSQKYPAYFFIGSFIFYSFCAVVFLPYRYQTWDTYLAILMFVIGMWGFHRSSKKHEDKILIKNVHLRYLIINNRLKDNYLLNLHEGSPVSLLSLKKNLNQLENITHGK
ncbi:hypothetical protein SJ093_18260 [Citrobacter freundii]|uniref:hypothetical protein n=1 Tax=Citrobacter freundii TaxID=546 RepID=UPI000FDCC9B8|nr:hypothetical protein [Citrobacter freundii]HED4020357.1 hypothetical protein [Escherichia coli]MCT4736242.1 hypothetical protein [Citrobacter freundii]MDT7068133.1 hypothetical protein [Citrobacter freundii]MDT7083177.1 hypothetical protein [Citrobacter freundii]MDT7137464.1 hypothetical protein [Citrobacter freundii]